MTAANSNLLEEFRAASLSPALLQSLLHRLLSHPKIFNGFTDILNLPSVRETLGKLDESKRSVIIKTVELFAFGTVNEYYEIKAKDEAAVWTLNDAQLEKLRMLSIVSIAREQIESFNAKNNDGGGDVEMADDAPKMKKRSKKKKNKKNDDGMLSISYSRLASELHMTTGNANDEMANMRQLEDLLIQAIYSNVIAAKLDQSSKSLKIEPHVALMHEPAGGSLAGGSKKDGVSMGGVYGSLFSRDLNISTKESTNAEVTRMISTVQQFLKQSNGLLATLEHSSKACGSDRKEDELRWREVQKAIEDCPTKLREGASAGGGGMGSMMGMGGSGDPMEVVDLVGRRQVKRSKGGHSMMGGGGVRFG